MKTTIRLSHVLAIFVLAGIPKDMTWGGLLGVVPEHNLCEQVLLTYFMLWLFCVPRKG